jgi:ribokinase
MNVINVGGVVVVGSVNIDVSSRVEELPRAGETVLAAELHEGLGGKGANQAIAAARAGAAVVMLACVGTDAAGSSALARLRQEGIDTGGVLSCESLPTGRAFICVDACGQNQIVVSSGANAALRPDDLDLLRGLIEPAGLLLTGGELDSATVVRAAELAALAGRRFVLNLAPVIDLPASTLAQSDPLIVNELEAEMLGISTASLEQDLAEAVDRVARSIVVTLGHAGAMSARAGVVTRHPAPRVTPVDTTGAGDAFVGTLVAALSRGASLEQATDEAVVAGAKSVQHRGASSPQIQVVPARDGKYRLASRTRTSNDRRTSRSRPSGGRSASRTSASR